MDETPRIDAGKLRDFAEAAFTKVGMPKADAYLTAEPLVQSLAAGYFWGTAG
jgi:LDH2 family malate/lactate/ureidoglycolate dehydrogenase